MIRRPPGSTRADALVPDPTHFRSIVRMGLVALPSDAAHGVKAGPGPAPTVDLDGVGVEPDPARYSGFTAAGQRRTLTDFPGAGLRSPSQGTCAQSATGRAFRKRDPDCP